MILSNCLLYFTICFPAWTIPSPAVNRLRPMRQKRQFVPSFYGSNGQPSSDLFANQAIRDLPPFNPFSPLFDGYFRRSLYAPDNAVLIAQQKALFNRVQTQALVQPYDHPPYVPPSNCYPGTYILPNSSPSANGQFVEQQVPQDRGARPLIQNPVLAALIKEDKNIPCRLAGQPQPNQNTPSAQPFQEKPQNNQSPIPPEEPAASVDNPFARLRTVKPPATFDLIQPIPQ